MKQDQEVCLRSTSHLALGYCQFSSVCVCLIHSQYTMVEIPVFIEAVSQQT